MVSGGAVVVYRSAMEKRAYWDIVEAARAEGGDAREVAERVEASLRTRPAEVVFEFALLGKVQKE